MTLPAPPLLFPKFHWIYKLPRRCWTVLLFLIITMFATLVIYLNSCRYTDEELRERIRKVSFDFSKYEPIYLLNQPNVCSIFTGNKWPAEGATGPALSILLYIHTRPRHFARRAFLRQAWLHPRFKDGENYSIRSVFILGNPHNPSIQKKLQEESDEYHDLVQEDFFDVYENQTIKEAAALRWTDTHCSSASFVVKADDDTIIKPWMLTDIIRKHFDLEDTRKPRFLCKVHRNEAPQRNPREKDFVPASQFSRDVFPDHCDGALRITTTSTVSRLVQSFAKVPYLWLENVYITGVVGKLVGAVHNHDEYFLSDTRDVSLSYSYFTRRNSPWVAMNAHDFKLVRKIWREITENSSEHNFEDGLDKILPELPDEKEPSE